MGEPPFGTHRPYGSVAQTLVERPGFGRSEHWAPVRFAGDAAVGSVAAVKLLSAGPDLLEGALL